MPRTAKAVHTQTRSEISALLDRVHAGRAGGEQQCFGPVEVHALRGEVGSGVLGDLQRLGG